MVIVLISGVSCCKKPKVFHNTQIRNAEGETGANDRNKGSFVVGCSFSFLQIKEMTLEPGAVFGRV
jgi:hypothetical protein